MKYNYLLEDSYMVTIIYYLFVWKYHRIVRLVNLKKIFKFLCLQNLFNFIYYSKKFRITSYIIFVQGKIEKVARGIQGEKTRQVRESGVNNSNISKSPIGGRNQVSGRVSVPCFHATPVANAPNDFNSRSYSGRKEKCMKLSKQHQWAYENTSTNVQDDLTVI